MLIGLAVLIHASHVVPREGVTVLAQLTAGAFGTGWLFYGSAFRSRGAGAGREHVVRRTAGADRAYSPTTTGCPTCSGFGPNGRFTAMASWRLRLPPGCCLIAVGGDTHRLVPLFAIGVFIGFTISQTGLVRHWATTRPPGWRLAPRSTASAPS